MIETGLYKLRDDCYHRTGGDPEKWHHVYVTDSRFGYKYILVHGYKDNGKGSSYLGTMRTENELKEYKDNGMMIRIHGEPFRRVIRHELIPSRGDYSWYTKIP